MRHLKKGKKFHRKRGPRQTFLRNLAGDLIRYKRVETTEARAKAIRPIVEKMVTVARRKTLASRRLLLSRLHNKRLVAKLSDEIAPAYTARPGGYLRIRKLAITRKRDGGKKAVIEFV